MTYHETPDVEQLRGMTSMVIGAKKQSVSWRGIGKCVRNHSE